MKVALFLSLKMCHHCHGLELKLSGPFYNTVATPVAVH